LKNPTELELNAVNKGKNRMDNHGNTKCRKRRRCNPARGLTAAHGDNGSEDKVKTRGGERKLYTARKEREGQERQAGLKWSRRGGEGL
jgi:hypothetical protein